MSLTLNGNHKIFIMFIDNTHAMRYPKSLLTMVSVYSFTAASILTSIIFSLLLFLSIDESLLMKFLFGSLAVIFELGKFFAWYEYGERRAHKNYSGAVIALLFYLVLAIISIGVKPLKNTSNLGIYPKAWHGFRMKTNVYEINNSN